MSHEPVYGIPPDLIRGPESDVLPQAGEINWGMDVFGVPALRAIAGDREYKVGVVDTGIDESHPLLAPNFAKARDFTGSSVGYRDRHGHGTHVSGTVGASDSRIGVSTHCKLYHGKGLGDSGSGGNGLLSAIEWCLSEGCTVVSNSWGGGGQSADWEREFKKWSDSGAWLIFAAGNSGPNTPNSDWPGRSDNLLNVAALNQDLSPASFSSSGDKLDTSGPGVSIWSCRPGGGFANMSGTSMATPFVASVLATFRTILESRGMPIPNVYDLRKLLFSRSTDTHTPGDDRRTGPGWVAPILLALDTVPDPAPLRRT